ncbi:hypothetical protein BGW42_007255 [Actinomortierella wolfii]|nr:hypothetical protein BGW42_007255 [Actinomortierella wolfii]KAG0242563.1 hypothetical protein BGW41_003921 [Actinomortierella wolfii]
MKTLTILAVAVASSFAMLSEAHISLRYPCPRRASYAECPKPSPPHSWADIDYNTSSPIGTHGTINNPLPKHPDSFAGPRPVLKAGTTISTTYAVGAVHKGGSCQWTLSYDGGKTQVVIKDWFRNCLRDAVGGQTYTIPVAIPANAPSGPALFTWIWNNNEGNRELYSTSADVIIDGKNGGSISGVAPALCNYGPSSCFIAEESVSGGNWGEAHFNARKPITITVPPN